MQTSKPHLQNGFPYKLWSARSHVYMHVDYAKVIKQCNKVCTRNKCLCYEQRNTKTNYFLSVALYIKPLSICQFESDLVMWTFLSA